MISSAARLCGLLLAFALLVPTASAQEPAPVEVMVVGVYHMANPGRDLHNVRADDVLTPPRQAEIAGVTSALARFRPTRVMVEWPAATTAERWERYRAGTLPTSRNEVVQLGFRLAQQTGAQVTGIDVQGLFPYGAVTEWAQANGRTALVEQEAEQVRRDVAAQERRLSERGVAGVLRYLNDPALSARSHSFYRNMLRLGSGDQQPGAELLSAWYRRNALICANLIQNARPGDRVIVFYGAGHNHLLRQCVQETPGFRLVEATAYLPS